MAALKLVHSNTPGKARKQPKASLERPFLTNYAGAWPGRCKTRESAMVAAVKHIVNDGYNRATITDMRTGQDVARIRLSSDRQRAVIETVKPFVNSRR